MNEFAWAFLSAVLISLISLVGLALMGLREETVKRLMPFLISLATGALFGDAVLHLLPEVFHGTASEASGSAAVLAGLLCSFVLEKFLRWRHAHGIEHDHRIKPVGRIILTSDGLHNFIDGLLIGVGYQAGLSVGLATTLAVALHELPHEIGDYAILVDSGWTRGRALALNFLCACVALAGVLAAFALRSRVADFTRLGLALTAGSFLYIAGSNLTPELQKEENPFRSLAQLGAMAVGIVSMALLRYWN